MVSVVNCKFYNRFHLYQHYCSFGTKCVTADYFIEVSKVHLTDKKQEPDVVSCIVES